MDALLKVLQFISYGLISVFLIVLFLGAFSPLSPFCIFSRPAVAPASDSSRIEEMTRRLEAIEARLEKIEKGN